MQTAIEGILRGLSRLRRRGTARTVDFLDRALAQVGFVFPRWLGEAYALPRLYVTPERDSLQGILSTMQTAATETIATADQILNHQFNLLGSGLFSPLDPDRAGSMEGYRPIDWALDPVRKLRFPTGFQHSKWSAASMRPGNADIKYPWELARCQHWPVLGQAWQLTRESRYAEEIANELDDFMAANPVGTGVNWLCAMDVALRALNWAIGLELVRDCVALDETFWRRAYRHLFDHGVFIFANLENKYEVTSNHFLSNVIGLYYLSSVFRELEDARAWNAFCRESLEHEMEVQILPDGADYESSIPYHRLVTELFLGAARLANFRGEPLSPAYCGKLHAMVDFLAGTLRPDGLMPQVGDADDGRLHILSGYGQWNPQDGRHLFGPAAFVLDEPRWLRHAGPNAAWETFWWGFGISGTSFEENKLPDNARLFPDAGLAVVRRSGTYLLVTNGIVGTKGFGNHKHNDQLGFELHLAGQPLIVDPGSYVYTSDPTARNLFRGTAYHNTLMIDGLEQNEMNPEWLFRLFETARAETLEFHQSAEEVRYAGRHVGYTRLTEPVTHERVFRLSSTHAALLIADRLEGRGTHARRWHFHIAPGVLASDIGQGVVMLAAGDGSFMLVAPDVMRPAISDAWYSPSYGIRTPCLAIDFEQNVAVNSGYAAAFAIFQFDGSAGGARAHADELWPDRLH